MTVLHDNMYGRHSTKAIPVKAFRSINGPVDRPANPIVIGRKRQDLNAILNPVHAFNAFDGLLSVGFQSRASHLAEESYGAPLYFVRQVIENVVHRKHHQFMTDFLLKAHLPFCRWRTALLSP